MRIRGSAALRMIAVGALASATLAVVQPMAAVASGCGAAGSLPGAQLFSVAAVSSSNAWAIGRYSPVAAYQYQTLIEHWDGHAWCQVPSPDPGGSGQDNTLESVAATSSSNAWAIGYYRESSGIEQTLILHWDGKAWRQASSPNLGVSVSSELDTVMALSSSNAWAAGLSGNLNLLLHWNGARWQTMAIPSAAPTRINGVDALAATSSSTLFAFGYHQNTTLTEQVTIQRLNGSSWTTQSSPSLGGATAGGYLTGAKAFSASNAWAVGHYFNSSTMQTLIEHWNGSKWVLFPHPNPGSGANFSVLSGLAVTSPSSMWAAGLYQVHGTDRTLVEWWNGSSWTIQPSPNLGGSSVNNFLQAAAAISSSDVWAVGSYDHPNRTLILHWNGRSWTQVPSP
jgi:hypothetical protein